MPATREFKYLPPDQPLLPQFVARLYRAHGLTAPRQRSRSDEARPPQGKLKAVIIHNRRFGPELVDVLRASAEACTATCSGLEVQYLNWTTVQPFSRQLDLLRGTDIHVSSFGTALYTSLLLPDGSVSVNLGMGSHERHLGLPSYGEEFLATSHRGLRTLYMPLDRLLRGPSVDDVVALLEQAGQVIRSGFPVPVESMEENLSVFGKIILNLTMSSEASHWGLKGWRRQDAAAAYTGEASAELALGNGSVLEYCSEDQTRCVLLRGHASPLVLESEPDFESCHVDVTLLRALKRSHGLKEALGVEEDCECVACQACGAGHL
uniref:Uncharacterized protein n=1 Tax=Alexandrium catenella TaxID=2925 RepID=A0A7S1R886_ALECA